MSRQPAFSMEPKKLPNKIYTDFVERISVAGWKETFDEPITWIRRTFQVTLILLCCCCLYNVYSLIVMYKKSGYKDNIQDINTQETLPFSNVTICAQVYFNQTFIKENVTIPNDVMDHYKTPEEVEEFYQQLTLFLSVITRPRSFSKEQVILFAKVLRKNPQFMDYSEFTRRAMPSCQSVLKRCWFDGMEFDCCTRALVSMDDDGVCFLLPFNYDSDNAFPSPLTLQQWRPGPIGGLTIEASLSTRDFPWLEDDAQNGYRILVLPVPYSSASSPETAPHGAETFIKVTPSMRSLITKCVEHNKLCTMTPPGGHLIYYDPEGMSCGLTGMINRVLKYVSCAPPTYLYWPNRTTVCKPMETYILSNYLATDDLVDDFKKIGSANLGISEARVTSFLQAIENEVKQILSEKSGCPKHCHYWTYTASASFIELENTKSNVQTDRMYSRIHIYYADFGYRQHEQAKETTAYLAFYAFCNIFILYLGMSVVSYFHLIFYVPRYVHMKWKRKVYAPTTQTKVVPFRAATMIEMANINK